MKTNVIYNEDCLKGMKKLRSESVEVVVTSPPYNIGIDYSSYRDSLDDSEFLIWISDIAQEIKRVLKKDGSFFLNIGGKPSQPLWPLQIAMVCARHFFLQNTIHWVKSIAIPMEDVGDYPHMIRDISVGHFKPVNSRYYLNNCHEYIFHFTKGGSVEIDKLAIGVEYQDKSNIKRWKTSKLDLRDRGNTWFIPYETIRVSRPHPAPFPVKLPEYCIKIHGLKRTKTVLDPFMGIGATALACVRLGVDYIGYELDEEYANIARERIDSEKSRLVAQPNSKDRKESKMYRVIVDGLDPTEMEPLTREVKGTGGYQSFIRKLQRQYSQKEGQIILDVEDIRRMPRYVNNYGQGGFQDRLSFLMKKLEEIHSKLSTAVESYKSIDQD